MTGSAITAVGIFWMYCTLLLSAWHTLSRFDRLLYAVYTPLLALALPLLAWGGAK